MSARDGIDDWIARAERRKQIRAELAARRAAGLERRHAAKLARNAGNQPAQSHAGGRKAAGPTSGGPPHQTPARGMRGTNRGQGPQTKESTR